MSARSRKILIDKEAAATRALARAERQRRLRPTQRAEREVRRLRRDRQAIREALR